MKANMIEKNAKGECPYEFFNTTKNYAVPEKQEKTKSLV